MTGTHNNDEGLRLGLVGCGWISRWHGRAARQVPGVEIVACCDINPEAAERFASEFGLPSAYDDHRKMFADAGLDGVVVASWPTSHHEELLDALAAGVRGALCEKSLAVDEAEMLEIWDAARQRGAIVMEGFAYRHHPTMRKVSELLAAGAIGALDNITAALEDFDPEGTGESEDAPDWASSVNWRSRKDLRGGVPFDMLCYCVNACNHIARSLPKQVMAISRESPTYGTVNRLYGLIEYENDVVGIVSTSKRSDFNYELKINGATGNIVVPSMVAPNRFPPREAVEDGEHTEIYLRRRSDLFAWTAESIEVPAADPFAAQMANFAGALRGGRHPLVPLTETVLNVATIMALLRSAEEHAAVPVVVPADVRQVRESEWSSEGAAAPTERQPN